ncbi:hypothetical protein C1Y11_17920 [Pseudomonas sp. FW305-20]|nr:hypothetical protein C1Y11_17920 [Pseudomonas sp. FW305-20]PMU17787.1 hypothetical protein C1Y10_15015 [Pseudomonas sp. FW305-122]PMU38719.1 hypothetical protein C1Y12_15735 [Pseudomonas sp. FW305-47B]PMX61628.1 hypothetical protein C1Y13_11425 [Pseudomonas sp. FW305-33]PMX70464.1 hypothetical protein C1X12_04485 [Pseudomonas sp. FW305-60]
MHRKSKARRPTGRPVSSTLARIDRSHAPRGNAAGDAPRSAVDARLESCAGVTRSVTGCIPTQSVGTISWVSGAVDLALALAFDLDLPAPFPEAERRRCAGGTAARMPR